MQRTLRESMQMDKKKAFFHLPLLTYRSWRSMMSPNIIMSGHRKTEYRPRHIKGVYQRVRLTFEISQISCTVKVMQR